MGLAEEIRQYEVVIVDTAGRQIHSSPLGSMDRRKAYARLKAILNLYSNDPLVGGAYVRRKSR